MIQRMIRPLRTLSNILTGLLIFMMLIGCGDDSSDSGSKEVLVRFNTSMGSFDVRLAEDQAPLTVKNFMTYVDAGFYDDLIFHRVIEGFMIQGGGYDSNLTIKDTFSPIDLEIAPSLLHTPGVIAMARTSDPDSATSQFFINVAENSSLNNDYATFGQVETGYEVVENISKVETESDAGFSNVPVNTVQILSITRVEE